MELEVLETVEPEVWNGWARSLPGSHILQSWQWGHVKSDFGWKPYYLVWRHSAESQPVGISLVLQRSLTLGGFSPRLRVLYAPKGPLLDWGDEALRNRVLQDLQSFARQQGAIFIKVDPDIILGTGVPGEPEAYSHPLGRQVTDALQARGWTFSDDQIQYRNTVIINVAPDEDQILAGMKQKTRYNVRLAGRRGVEVRVGGPEDLELLYQMFAETSVRDGFVIRDAGYYLSVWSTFMQDGMAEALIAEVDGEAVAGLVIFFFAGKAWYLYGMSREAHREKMPNYLLQWEAMRRAKQAGCQVYDLWGAPDHFNPDDSMWGVYRFKDGLGGKVVRHIGAWDYPAQPLFYKLYTRILPRFLDLMRRRGRAAAREAAG